MKVIQNYTPTLNFVKKKFIDILKHIDIQSQANYDEHQNSKKSLHILENCASGVQIDNIEQVVV